jgi:hypothetical protein
MVPNNELATAHVYEHALWYAACLAHETARDDRFLEDAFAARLAGSRGADLFGAKLNPTRAFTAPLRAATVDDVLQRAIFEHHIHTVVTVGQGLDARPYRLSLPNDLRWIELERHPLIVYKELRLAHVQPACRVERVAVEPSEQKGRRDAIRRATQGVARGLLLTEDTDAGTPSSLLQELAKEAPAGLKWWILTTVAADRGSLEALTSDRWRIVDWRPLRDEALRLSQERLRRFEAQAPVEHAALDFGAVWLLKRSSRSAFDQRFRIPPQAGAQRPWEGGRT